MKKIRANNLSLFIDHLYTRDMLVVCVLVLYTQCNRKLALP